MYSVSGERPANAEPPPSLPTIYDLMPTAMHAYRVTTCERGIIFENSSKWPSFVD